jgi:hypothetical protein
MSPSRSSMWLATAVGQAWWLAVRTDGSIAASALE